METGRSPPWILTDIPSQAPFEAPLRNLRLLDQVMLLEVMRAMEAVQAMEVKASRQTLSPGSMLLEVMLVMEVIQAVKVEASRMPAMLRCC